MKYSLAVLTALALVPTAGRAGNALDADPTDPGSAVPPFKYLSNFHGYSPYGDAATVAEWRNTRFDAQAPRQRGMDHMPVQARAGRAAEASGSTVRPGHASHAQDLGVRDED